MITNETETDECLEVEYADEFALAYSLDDSHHHSGCLGCSSKMVAVLLLLAAILLRSVI